MIRTHYADRSPFVSFVIVNYNGQKWIKKCLDSICRLNSKKYEVIMVDNASYDESVKLVKNEFPWVQIVENNANLGYAEGCNLGLSHASGKIIAFLNMDVLLESNWLEELVKVLTSEKNIGACCGKFFDFHGEKLQFPSELDVPQGSLEKCREIRNVYGAAFATKRSALQKIGLFDSKFFLYYDEIDWSWRLRLTGYKCIFVPTAIAYHSCGGGGGSYEQRRFLTYRNRLRTLIKNCEALTLLSFTPLVIFELLYSLFSSFSRKTDKRWRGLSTARSMCQAIFWNIKFLKDTLKERAKVQHLRVNSDKYINAKLQDVYYRAFLLLLNSKENKVSLLSTRFTFP